MVQMGSAITGGKLFDTAIYTPLKEPQDDHTFYKIRIGSSNGSNHRRIHRRNICFNCGSRYEEGLQSQKEQCNTPVQLHATSRILNTLTSPTRQQNFRAGGDFGNSRDSEGSGGRWPAFRHPPEARHRSSGYPGQRPAPIPLQVSMERYRHGWCDGLGSPERGTRGRDHR